MINCQVRLTLPLLAFSNIAVCLFGSGLEAIVRGSTARDKNRRQALLSITLLLTYLPCCFMTSWHKHMSTIPTCLEETPTAKVSGSPNEFPKCWVASSEKLLLLLSISAAFPANLAAFSLVASAVHLYSRNLGLNMRASAEFFSVKLRRHFPPLSAVTFLGVNWVSGEVREQKLHS